MRKTIATIALAGLGLFSSAQKNKEIPKDTTIVTYHSDTLLKTIYLDKTIQEKEYALKGDEYQLIREKMSEYNDSGKIALEKEDFYVTKTKSLTKSSSDPKNLKSKVQETRLASSLKVNEYHYDDLGRLVKIDKMINNKIGQKNGKEQSAEYFFYVEKNRNAFSKLEDNDGDGKFSDGDKASIYNPKTKDWDSVEKTE